MAYSQGGYVPSSFDDILERLIVRVNAEFGTEYTRQTFIGTNFYKCFYPIIQEFISAEADFAEAYEKLSDYIRQTNAVIAVSKTPDDALIKTFKQAGYTLSLDANTLSNAGKIAVCVDVDNSAADYATKKAEILELLKENTVAGMYFVGGQRGNRTLSNGQDMEFAFALPLRTNVELKLTLTLSNDTNILVDGEDVIKDKLLANLAEMYALGRKFEPERYFTISRDCPYAAAVKLEYKLSGAENYSSAVYQSLYTDLFVFDKENIEVILQ